MGLDSGERAEGQVIVPGDIVTSSGYYGTYSRFDAFAFGADHCNLGALTPRTTYVVIAVLRGRFGLQAFVLGNKCGWTMLASLVNV